MIIQVSHMYKYAKTWNPFVGCRFNCIYCKPSFQQQLKRQKHRCKKCYYYVPHTHEERLKRIPSSRIVFVCGDGDISFAPVWLTNKIIDRIKEHNKRCPHKIYYFQSKEPKYFEKFLDKFPKNVFLLTTLETNRDEGYEKISRAPPPSERFKQFLELDYPRKIVTIEPIMDFDLEEFVYWIKQIKPKAVYIGYNSRPKQVQLPEPSNEKFWKLVHELDKFTNVIIKNLRSVIS